MKILTTNSFTAAEQAADITNLIMGSTYFRFSYKVVDIIQSTSFMQKQEFVI